MLHTNLVLLAALSPATFEAPTWSGEIAALMYTHCAECHRPGEAAPFPLLEYEDVKKRARMLQLVMDDGYMPPWHPVEGHGEFVGQRGLTEAELERFAAWIEGACPEGDPAAAPAQPTFGSEWRLGEPDLVLEMDAAFTIPADGPDIYRNFCLPLALDEDKWIRAIEVRPEARSVVHHVLFFSDDTGNVRRMDAADPVPGFSGMTAGGGNPLGGWAVGGGPFALPEPLAMPLPKGSDLLLQTHFHPSGKQEQERTKIGVYFAEEPPKRIVSVQLPPQYAAFAGLDVAAGLKDFTLRDSMLLPVDTELVTVGAHAHYIGKTMRAWAVLPDGEERPLFLIDDWDFNWQGRYLYQEPITLPAGTRLEVELVYDNSAENPRNPYSPPERITWGLESTDEMGAITWIAIAKEAGDTKALSEAVRAKFADARRNRKRVRVDWYARVMRLDQNGDGRLSADEIPEQFKSSLARMDTNEDGELSAKELEALKSAGRRDG
ncbi:MAG: hypothetical protein O2816_06920 [Planctomycetota bacterium]|nr:hypothetical protein [Planctomycetota bacterium]